MESPRDLLRRLSRGKSSQVDRWHKGATRPNIAPHEQVMWEDTTTGKVRLLIRLRDKIYTFDPSQVEQGGIITEFEPSGGGGGGGITTERVNLTFDHGVKTTTFNPNLGGREASTNQGFVPPRNGHIAWLTWLINPGTVVSPGNLRIQLGLNSIYQNLTTISMDVFQQVGALALTAPAFTGGNTWINLRLQFSGFSGSLGSGWYGLGLELD